MTRSGGAYSHHYGPFESVFMITKSVEISGVSVYHYILIGTDTSKGGYSCKRRGGWGALFVLGIYDTL